MRHMHFRPLPSQDTLRSLFDYDPLTGIFRRKRDGKRVGWVSDGYIRIKIGRKDFLAHRLAWKYSYGIEPDVTDHANGDGTDNRLANLRAATLNQNARNSKGKSRKGLPKGVAEATGGAHDLYQAMIRIDGKPTYLGCFKSAEEAHEAYKRAAKKHHGEFARY